MFGHFTTLCMKGLRLLDWCCEVLGSNTLMSNLVPSFMFAVDGIRPIPVIGFRIGSMATS